MTVIYDFDTQAKGERFVAISDASESVTKRGELEV